MNKISLIKLGLFLALSSSVSLANAIDLSVPGTTTLGNEDKRVVSPIDSGDYDEGVRYCEGASHEHTHYNNSTDTASQEFWGVMHGFAIVFEEDFLESVNTNALLCTDGSDTYRNCGFDKETDLGKVVYSISGGQWSGVSVKYQELDWISGSPKGLYWEYGTSNPADIDLKPWLASGTRHTEAVSFSLKDYNSVQTATTTSWTKMEFYYIDPDEDHSVLSNWKNIYTEEVEPYSSQLDPDGDYIYWYGINGTVVSRFPSCPPTEGITCESLSISPTTGDLSINDVFSDVDFTVTATGSDGSDITKDSKFTYSINKFGSAKDAADADGQIRYGFNEFLRSKNPSTNDASVKFSKTEPGDSLYVYVSDYEGKSYEDTCYAEVEFPYCSDLNITDPTGPFDSNYLGSISGTEFSSNITVETTSSTGEPWPFNIVYESSDATATFDGNTSPYTTTDSSITTYTSSNSSNVSVSLNDQNKDGESDDVAGVCNDEFFYTLVPEVTLPTCDYLEFTTEEPLSVEIMEAGNVEISWESVMTDGNQTPPPYLCTSSNAEGLFRDGTGATGRGIFNTNLSTVFYTGESGDSISCRSFTYPICTDTLTSEEPPVEAPICTDLELDDPYVTGSSGAKINIDLSDEDDLETLYDNDTVCFDFSIETEAGFRGTLQATGYTDDDRDSFTSGLIELNVNRGGSYIGNPATVGLSGSTNYTGTLCWENYDEDYTLDLEVISENACEDTVTLPPINETPEPPEPPEEYTCEDVVDVNNPDDSQICEEYSMEVCVEDDDIEVVSDGDEICYYDSSDKDRSDPIACEDDVLEIEGESRRECYDVVIEGNVCQGDLEVIYPDSEDGRNEVCWDDSPEQSPIGELNKYIYTFNFLSEKAYNSDEDIFFSHDEDRVFYTLEYSPSGGEEAITFTDEMWGDEIEGTLGENGEDSGGSVYQLTNHSQLTEYNYESIRSFGLGESFEEDSENIANQLNSRNASDFMSFVPYLKYEDGSESEWIDACVYSTNEDGEETLESRTVCYDPNYTPEDDGKVVIENVGSVEDASIRIRYIGIIDSGIQDLCDGDQGGDCLTELFKNTATVTSGSESASDSATLVVICSYLLTINGGDIYLEGNLNTGSDISCAYIDDDRNYSSYSNSDGLVILDSNEDDDDDDSRETSSSTSLSDDDISACDNESSDNLIGNISSYVCEIVSAVNDIWKKSTISTTTNDHLSQATRNVSTVQAYNSYSGDLSSQLIPDLRNANNPNSGILYFQGSASEPKITLNTITVPCGAWTLIVNGADLHLAGDVKYATSCTDGSNITQKLPSIAFIVTGGDIYIEDSAYHLAGVYYTDQAFDGDPRSAVDGALHIDGSLYGNIQPLLDAADYVGPPTLDGGSIVVRYDSRILINTPPALSEYVDVNTEKAVN